jgi:hypothetical protein
MLSPDFDISTNSLPVFRGEKRQDLPQFVAFRLTQISPVAFRENRQQKDRNVRTAVIADNARTTSPAFRFRAQRSFLAPPVPCISSPEDGRSARKSINSRRSVSVRIRLAPLTNSGVSTIVWSGRFTG